MKKIVSLIIGLACCGSAVAQPSYTLEQLKQMAIENNYNVRSARTEIQRSKQQRNEAFTKYFPTVSATGMALTFNKYLINIDLGLPQALQALLPAGVELPSSVGLLKSGVFGSVSAIQPVFMGGMIINSNRLAKVGQEASEIKLEVSEDEVELTTENYYWQVVSLKEKLKTLDAVHQMLDELEKDVANRVRVGVTNRNDLLQVQLRKGEVESKTLEAKNGLNTISQLLAQHIGKADQSIDVALPSELSDRSTATVPELPLALHQDHQVALTLTPQYRLLQKNVESQRLKHKMTVGENLPKVGVGASYGYNNFFERGRGNGALFVGVNVPITGWWGGSHAIKRQKMAYEDAKEQLVDNGQKLVIRMNKAWAAIETSHQKLLIAHDAIAQADENLRLNRDYYRVGLTKMSDLLLAQEYYQSARDRYTDAYAEFQTKIMEYRQATGQE